MIHIEKGFKNLKNLEIIKSGFRIRKFETIRFLKSIVTDIFCETNFSKKMIASMIYLYELGLIFSSLVSNYA